MGFRRKLVAVCVKNGKLSNKEVITLMAEGKISVNSQITRSNIEITEEDEISIADKIIKSSEQFFYFKFYKPAGVECTLNDSINDNLLSFLPKVGLFPVGRLDKFSEGLLLLTNDGRIYDRVLRHENKLEKTYEVVLDKSISSDFKEKMESGIIIMGKMTLPCRVEVLDERSFEIVLTQGLNRQIRRMTYKLGYEVLKLKRTQIGPLKLEHLLPGELIEIEKPVF